MGFKFEFDAEVLNNNTTADAEADKKGGSFLNTPGVHDVTLKVLKADPKPEPNSHWVGLRLECKTAEGKACQYFIDFPLTSVLTNTLSNGQEAYYAYGALKRFLVGCGIAESVGEIKAGNIHDLVPLVFGDPNKTFDGKEAKITLAWKKNTVHTELQEGFFVLVDHEGKHVEGVEKLKAQEFDKEKNEVVEDENTYSFKDASDTLEAEASIKGLKYKGFLDAVGFSLKEPITKEEPKTKGKLF